MKDKLKYLFAVIIVAATMCAFIVDRRATSADTVRTEAALQTLLADNTSRAISPQDLRDLLVSAKVDQFVVANTFDGDDIGAKINNAIAFLNASGGDVYILAGSYEFSTTIDTGVRNNIRIIGQGGVSIASPGTTASGTTLVYTGATKAITIGGAATTSYGVELQQFKLELSTAVVGVYIDNHVRGRMDNFVCNGLHSNRVSTGIQTSGTSCYGWILNDIVTNYHSVGMDIVNGHGWHLRVPRIVLNLIGIKLTGGAGTYFHGGDIELNDTAGIEVISGQQTVVHSVYFENKDEVGSRCVRVGSGADTPVSVVVDGCRFKRDGTAAEYAIELAKVRGAKIVNNYFDNYATSAIKNAAGATEIEYDYNTVHGSLPLFIDSYAGVNSGYDPVDGSRVMASLPTSDPGVVGQLYYNASTGVVSVSK